MSYIQDYQVKREPGMVDVLKVNSAMPIYEFQPGFDGIAFRYSSKRLRFYLEDSA